MALSIPFFTFVLAIFVAATAMNKQAVVSAQPVADIVTDNFFDSIMNQAAAGCPGKKFYSRQGFLRAANGYFPQFGQRSNADASKREIAAFFAHVAHETDHFCHIQEENRTLRLDNCDKAKTHYPCAPGKKYYGRGPLQLTWNYNYGAAGNATGFDLLNFPELVASRHILSFKTALWFWMQTVRPVIDQGFGATIRAINSKECNGANPETVRNRIKYYTDYCKEFGVAPGDNLSC